MIKRINKPLNLLINYFSVCCVLVVLFSCHTNSNSDRDHLVFRYNEHKNIGSLDPAFAKDNADIWAVNQLFNGLVQMDANLNVKPCIAKSWTISPDGLLYTFNLRTDVLFHTNPAFKSEESRLVKAEDFEFSFNRIIDPKVASPGSWVFQNVEKFSALGTHTFQIKLKTPFPAFLSLLTMKYCSVVPKLIVSNPNIDFRSTPVGTGPFLFKRWEENIKLVFRKNNNYFEKDLNGNTLPYLEAVSITFLPDKQSEFLQFAQGNIDFVSGLDASYKDEILTADGQLNNKYKSTVNMLRAPYLNTEYLAFYMDNEIPEIQSQLIRKAVNHGFDREKMMLYLRNGVGIPADGGFIPKGLPGYNNKIGFKYNPELAKKLVDSFKLSTTNQNPKITLTTTGNYLSFCEFIQREIQKIGLEVSVDVVPAATLKNAKANGKLDLFRASWVADYPDAQNYLSLYYSKNFAPLGPNYTHFSSPTFDSWYENALKETDVYKRELLYSKMDSLVMAKTPIVPLFYDEVVRFTTIKVKGLGINPINLLDLKYVKKEH
ncbi:MAG: ABC transporter substrate-binding protein [Bacteroidetes bacterium MedPE-SWsnd-G2]|nr:MAG: ABC transporter substrate-binding protein [Bacteroidetes bacterium MedPE-SWsnd-G2]